MCDSNGFFLGSHQLVADLRVERKFGMIEGMKDWRGKGL